MYENVITKYIVFMYENVKTKSIVNNLNKKAAQKGAAVTNPSQIWQCTH